MPRKGGQEGTCQAGRTHFIYLWLKHINYKAEAPCRLFPQVLSLQEESSILGIGQGHLIRWKPMTGTITVCKTRYI